MIEKDDFINLEQLRLETLKGKIKSALIEFDKDKGIQWTGLKLEKVLLKTLLQSVENSTSRKPTIINHGTNICPECKCQLFRWYSNCPDCGQSIDWSVENELQIL